MRWNAKSKPEPRQGDKRIIRRVAWIPTRVADEWVWLESYQVLQEFKSIVVVTAEIPTGEMALIWVDIKYYDIATPVEKIWREHEIS